MSEIKFDRLLAQHATANTTVHLVTSSEFSCTM